MKQYLTSDTEAASITEESFALLSAPQQLSLLAAELHAQVHNWVDLPLPLPEMARELLADEAGPDSFDLRIAYASYLLWSGSPSRLRDVLQPLFDAVSTDPAAAATAAVLEAAATALRGAFSDAEDMYDLALTSLRAATRKRKTDLPELLTLPYVLSLLSLQSRESWDKALAFCRSEAGTRQSGSSTPYEVLMLAIEIRTGVAERPEPLFKLHGEDRHTYRLDLWLLLMRAWLANDEHPGTLGDDEAKGVKRLQAQLAQLELHALASLVKSAAAVLAGDQPTRTSSSARHARSGARRSNR